MPSSSHSQLLQLMPSKGRWRQSNCLPVNQYGKVMYYNIQSLCPPHGCTCAFCRMLRTLAAHASCAFLFSNHTTHYDLRYWHESYNFHTTHCHGQCRVSLCSHVISMLCRNAITLVLLHMLLYVYLLQHPYNVLCLAIACVFDAICLPTFFQSGQDCFLLACGLGHQEIVRELLTRDEVDRNVVDKVRN